MLYNSVAFDNKRGFSGLVLRRPFRVAALLASVFIFWNVSISTLSFAEDRGPCLSVRQLVLR